MKKQEHDGDHKARLVKMHIGPEDHARLRLAAVMRGQGIGEFCRNAVVTNAKEVTKNVELPRMARKVREPKK